MRDLDEEPALLTVLEETFRKFDGFVTYNGAGFDLPLLETRFVLGRRRFPGEVFHVDLLGPARRLWSARLVDCRLGTVEQDVLGFLRDDDLPGALIPTVYFEYLRRKRPGRAAARVRAQPARHPLARRAHRLGRGRGGARAASRARSGSARRSRPDARGRGPGAEPGLLSAGARQRPADALARAPAAAARAPREAPGALGRGARALGGGGPRAARVRPAAVGGDRQGPRAPPARSRGRARGGGAGPRARPAAPGLRPGAGRVRAPAGAAGPAASRWVPE